MMSDVGSSSARTASAAVAGRWPVTQYARSGELNIAFQVLGEGPPDLVFVPGFVTNLELAWDWPALAAFQQALASFSRLIVFDKRGTGLSDRVKEMPSTEERMDDLRAVMDAARSERAALLGVSEGATMAIAFSVAYPERVSSLILYAPLPKASRAPDYPWAEPEEWWDAVVERFAQRWGSPEYMQADAAWRAPSEANNEAFVEWWGVYRRLGASPGAAADLARINSRIDVRGLLPQIRVPTVVVVRERDRVVSVEHARYVAEHVPGAAYVELPGEDHLPFVGDAEAFVNAVAQVVGHDRHVAIPPPSDARASDAFGDAARVAGLSARECDVLRWVARGLTNAEIAAALYVSESTVRKHLQNSYRKLGVTTRTAAVARLQAATIVAGPRAGRRSEHLGRR
jgi:pimeloyl-ACP methyl ester carboxylesterase/DNA-binding CsgD family transcriptional regulator